MSTQTADELTITSLVDMIYLAD